MARYDDINSRSIFLAGVVSALVVCIVILGVRVLFFAMQDRQAKRKLLQSEYVTSEAHLERQATSLERYGVDPETGQIAIPIDRAIELVTTESQQENGDDRSAPDEV